MRWGTVIDQRVCIGCHACTVACKAENGVPLGVTRTYVRQVDVGRYPAVRRLFQVTRCNQCDDPPCAAICPVGAMFRRPDGIVDFDPRACVGCKACLAACPFDAIYMDPASGSAEKCNLCAHRLEVGMEPACVTVCPERAIVVGDLEDPASEVSRRLAAGPVAVRRPEKGTRPKVFYLGGSQAALDPLSAATGPFYAYAQRPPRGGFAGGGPLGGGLGWRATGEAAPGGGPGGRGGAEGTSGAHPALVTYAFPSGAGWDWRVSAYTWTKSVAAGAYLVPDLLTAAGRALPAAVATLGSAVALAALALTGLLLIADLKHPERFWRILVRPQWRSWLARGAYIITAYGLVLAVDLALGLAGQGGAPPAGGEGGALAGAAAARAWLRWAGVPLAAGAAAYTGFLFGQAKGRDLWQSPLLPWHLLVQAALAGASALLLITAAQPSPAGEAAGGAAVFLAALAAHVLFALTEAFTPHGTAAEAAAARALRTGRLGAFFWTGLAAGAAALLLGFLGARHLAAEPAAPALLGVAALLALVGLALGEHAYVQAGQVHLEVTTADPAAAGPWGPRVRQTPSGHGSAALHRPDGPGPAARLGAHADPGTGGTHHA